MQRLCKENFPQPVTPSGPHTLPPRTSGVATQTVGPRAAEPIWENTGGGTPGTADKPREWAEN